MRFENQSPTAGRNRMVGGLSASGGMLQRRLDLPDATVLVLQGLAFMLILGSEALYGRLGRVRSAA